MWLREKRDPQEGWPPRLTSLTVGGFEARMRETSYPVLVMEET